MTLRMSTLFEDSFRAMIKNLNSAKRRSNKDKENASKKRLPRSTRNNGAGPSNSQRNHHSGDSDDDDGNHPQRNGTAGRTRRTQAQSNGVSSSSQARDALPSTNKRLRPSRLKSSDDEDSSESSSESSDNSDESSGIPLADLGKSPKKAHKRRTTQKRATVSSSSAKQKSRNTKRRKVVSEEEPEHENSENDSVDKRQSSPEPKTSRRSGRMAPSRRIQSSSDDNGSKSNHNDKQRRTSRRPKRYESDQSFHVEAPNRRTADSDSDKPRATRESAKKKFIEWAITSGDEDDDDEDFEQKPQTSSQALRSAARQSARKKVIGTDSDQSEKKPKPVPSRRSTRTQRVSQSQSQSQDDGSDDDSDEEDKPSTSTSVRSSRLNGQPPVQASATLRTTRSSQNQQAPRSSSGNTDHNYGEPGPSSSAAAPPRQTRSTMILSRHQRNADELDRSGLEDSSLATNNQNTRLLRLRSVNLRAAPTPASNFEALNGIRRTMRNRATHNYFEDENENDADDTSNRFQPSHQNQVRTRVTRQEPPEDPSEDSDSFSDEDKTPLKSMASSSKKTHEHNTRRGSAAVNRVKRNLYSDDEQVCGTISLASADTQS